MSMTEADTYTHTLAKPIKHGETTITSLTFREATAGDACNADLVQGDFTKMLAVLAGMCGQPLPVLREVPMREMHKILVATAALMGEVPAAGGSK